MNKMRKQALAVVTAILLTAAGCGQPTEEGLSIAAPASGPEFSYDTRDSISLPAGLDAALEGFTPAAQSNALALYVNEEDGCVAAADKRTGKIWSSIPLDLEEDMFATDDMKELMHSVLHLEYEDKGVVNKLYSYEGSLEITEIENGVRLTFTMSNSKMTYDDLPSKINNERFQQFFVENESLTDIDKTRLGSYFEYNEAAGVWERVKENETVLRALGDIMKRVGYTEKELAKDNAENGIDYIPGDRIEFVIPVDYTLQADSLLVSIPLSEMSYHSSYPPTTLTVNELLLQAKGGTEGYFVVPDGSGALIDFSGSESDSGTYRLTLYGQELTLSNRRTQAKSLPSLMPVYGISAPDGAALAIMEDGDALASITAQKAYTLNEYNSVSVSYQLTKSAEVMIGDGSVVSQASVQQAGIYQGSLRTRYVLLEGNASYGTMADCYRKYLEETADFKSGGYDGKITPMLQLYGAVSKPDSIFGIQYDSMEKLTDFDQAQEIIGQYADVDFGNLVVKFSGTLEGGLKNGSVKKAKVLSSLGGAKGCRSLAEYLEALGGSLYLGADVLSVPQSSGGFSRYSQSARTIDQSIAKNYRDNLVTGAHMEISYLVSMRYLKEYLEAFASSLNRQGISGIAPSDLGNTLYGDYKQGELVTRQDAKHEIAATLAALTEGGSKILLDAPLISYLPYASSVCELPLTSNRDPLISRSIPFLPMVLSGSIPYAGEAYNQSEDKQEWLLRTLETGAEPYFALFYADNKALSNTAYTSLGSNHYQLWKEDTLAVIRACQRVREYTGDSHITGHDQLSAQVYRTTFSNGAELVVNYSSEGTAYQGTSVGAKNYQLFREGKPCLS